MKASMTVLGVIVALAGCGLLDGIDSAAICAEEARDHGQHFRVSGSFATTVGTVRGLAPPAAAPRWPELADDSSAVVCYVDGPFPKAPPGGLPFDRAVIAVAGDRAELIMAGYRDELRVRAP